MLDPFFNPFWNAFESASVPFWTEVAAIAAICQVAVLMVIARLVSRYLQETAEVQRLAQLEVAIANEQLETQIRPAIVVRPMAGVAGDRSLALVNVGKGPALHISLSATDRGAVGKRDLGRMVDDIGFLAPEAEPCPTAIRTQGAGINVLGGRSLQCEYSSLSGRTYWTVVDFDKNDNDRLIATRFNFERR